MIILNGSNDALKRVRLHSKRQLKLVVGSFHPFEGVILYLSDYALKGVKWLPFSFQWQSIHMLKNTKCNMISNYINDTNQNMYKIWTDDLAPSLYQWGLIPTLIYTYTVGKSNNHHVYMHLLGNTMMSTVGIKMCKWC